MSSSDRAKSRYCKIFTTAPHNFIARKCARCGNYIGDSPDIAVEFAVRTGMEYYLIDPNRHAYAPPGYEHRRIWHRDCFVKTPEYLEYVKGRMKGE